MGKVFISPGKRSFRRFLWSQGWVMRETVKVLNSNHGALSRERTLKQGPKRYIPNLKGKEGQPEGIPDGKFSWSNKEDHLGNDSPSHKHPGYFQVDGGGRGGVGLTSCSRAQTTGLLPSPAWTSKMAPEKGDEPGGVLQVGVLWPGLEAAASRQLINSGQDTVTRNCKETGKWRASGHAHEGGENRSGGELAFSAPRKESSAKGGGEGGTESAREGMARGVLANA